MFSIADLHCDLLCYLDGDSSRTAFDPQVRCSIPQLTAGNVKLQTMAVFTETGKDSVEKGMRQAAIFKKLPLLHPECYGKTIAITLAIENASSLCSEDESLEIGLRRIDQIRHDLGIVYISLTWNTENRFGGGAHTEIGLKHDGKVLLDFISGTKIALDLSHASDRLAIDALDYIDQKRLHIPVLASHSNFRAVAPVARNLPDELVKEIFQRKGLVGLNFVRDFVGCETSKNFIKQVEHGLKLGGAGHLCLGADFYFGGDVSPAFRKPSEKMFFPEFGNASSYPDLLALWKKDLGMGDDLLRAIAHDNLANWLINPSDALQGQI